jgi:hypothetical protein
MTWLDVLGLILAVTATVGLLAWCLALERRAAATASHGDDADAGSTYLLGCEYCIAMDVAPALARGRVLDADSERRGDAA